MQSARPITKEEYQQLLAELYVKADGKVQSRYKVDLDEDPSMSPRKLSGKFKEVQSQKDRVLVILNKALANEAFWKATLKKIDTKFNAAEVSAMIDPDVMKMKSKELREASAEISAGKKIVEKMFKGEGEYAEHYSKLQELHSDSLNFMLEVRNIYDNLDSTDKNLARQLKTVLLCAKLFGESEDEDDAAPAENNGALSVGKMK
jgi:hypothetical protein